MSNSFTGEPTPFQAPDGAASGPLSAVAPYGASLVFVAAATVVAFGLEAPVGAPNLALVFVLPVIAAASLFGWGPSLLATVLGVLAFDFFFTEPRYSLVISRPSDIWSAVLLLVIAAVVSAVAAESRRRELAARRSAEQATALQSLAHVVIQAGSPAEILAAAATALARIFRAPAVVFVDQAGELRLAASAGGARLTAAEEEAAKGTLDLNLPTHAETFPYPMATFDFWPVVTPRGRRCVIGVGWAASGRSRPAHPDRFIEIVGAYLAAAL